MDINIDDILAELDRDTTAVGQSDPLGPHSTFPSEGNTAAIESTVEQQNLQFKNVGTASMVTPQDDYKQLMVCWKNERCSPELLPYPHLLMKRMLRRIQEQMEYIETLSMGFLEDTDEAGNKPDKSNNSNHKLPILCMEAELERVKFVIRSYIRCRLNKIDKYNLYLRQLEDEERSIVPLSELLSQDELTYHDKHFAILLKLFNSSILKHMPAELQAIDDTEGSVNMIEEPNWNKFVFVQVQEGDPTDPLLETNEFGNYCYNVTIKDLNEEVELTVGGIYVIRYDVIRQLLMNGKVQLI